MQPYPFHDSTFRDPEPLPADFPASLRQADELLAREAGQAPVPAGLTDRVFRASVAGLPARRLEPPKRRLVAGAVPLRLATWGRLAMAASVALAFVVALRLMREQAPAPLDLARTAALPVEVEWLLMEQAGTDGEVTYLLDTRDMTFAELAGELAMLAANLEM